MSDWRNDHERDSLSFEDEEQAVPRGEAEGVRVLQSALTLERLGGWDVTPAAGAADALAAAQGGGFGAVLLDVMMPDVDGPRCSSACAR